ncbi:MAG: PD-(D/E)XK nuclease family transposase [Thermoguttaceae bacterium]|nr:PD-(D/E)XK nuclease family transposase [Thermoguttaceae bacterium]
MRSNTLSKTLDTSGYEAQYDERVKRLLSEKIVLAWILKGCAVEFQGLSVDRIVQECIEGDAEVATVAVDQDELDGSESPEASRISGMNAEDVSIREGKIFYDVRFSAVAPGEKEPIRLIVNVEAQKEGSSYPLIKRALYYVSRMISSQKNTVFGGSRYEKLRKVYSIWILTNAPEKSANTITQYRIAEEHVVGSVSEKKSDYDLLTVVMLRLGAHEKADDGALLRFLDVLLSPKLSPLEKKTILMKDFDVPMTTSMEEEAFEMCNIAEGIREEAEKKGRKEGREEGRKEGREEGREEGRKEGQEIGEKLGAERATQETRVDVALNLMNTLEMSAEEVLTAMRVPAQSRESLLKLINERLAAEQSPARR